MVAIHNLLILIFAAFALSLPVQKPACISVSFSVTINAKNTRFKILPDPNNTDDIKNWLDGTLNGTVTPVDGYQQVTGEYVIDGTYCRPPPSVTPRHTLQFLVHGLAYDKTYWNSHGNGDEYDYTLFATSQGYHTLAITRLGHGTGGDIPHPDPFNITQGPVHVDIAHRLIAAVKAGTLAPLGRFSKVVYVGHSYGSTVATYHAQEYPDDVVAYILTGFSSSTNTRTPFIPDLTSAAKVDPDRFTGIPLGYLASKTEDTATSVFFNGSFSRTVAQREFATRDTESVGEFLSAGLSPTEAVAYAGKVFVITGAKDTFFCDFETSGPCKDTLLRTRGLFPHAKYDFAVIPDTGHALNFHRSAKKSFREIHDWLDEEV